MANVVRDPREHPDAILPDLSKPDPLVHFTKDDIALVYGSKWKQRYFQKGGQRLLRVTGAMGRRAPDLATVFREERLRLVGTALPSGQHDVHGTENNALLIKPATAICLECHCPGLPNGPHTATIEQHTHHRAGSTGNDCVSCHMPKIEQTIADISVRSHTFRFITPAMTDAHKIPNPCTTCHKDKSIAWATAQLKSWPNVSPWRIE